MAKAVSLAGYLVALGELPESKSLLCSFVHEIEPTNDRRDIWGATGQGILLLAYINRLDGNTQKAKELTEIIVADDITEHQKNIYESYLFETADHSSMTEYAKSETPKYKCEILVGQLLTLIYYVMMLPHYKEIAPRDFEDLLESHIQEKTQCLRNALAGCWP